MKYSQFIFVGLLLPLSVIAQSISPTQLLKKVEDAMKDMTSVVYKIDYTEKHFTSTDTLSSVALCSLYIEPKDYIGVYYIIDEKVSDNGYTHTKYDGEYTSFIYYEKDGVKITSENYESESVKNDNYARVNSRKKFACLDVFDKKKPFTRYKSFFNRLFVKDLNVRESWLFNELVYELTIKHKNRKGEDYINDRVEIYYIRKSDYLPIAYSFYGEFEGMSGYEFVTIEYISTTPQLSADEFKVEMINEKVITETYYQNVQKHQL